MLRWKFLAGQPVEVKQRPQMVAGNGIGIEVEIGLLLTYTEQVMRTVMRTEPYLETSFPFV